MQSSRLYIAAGMHRDNDAGLVRRPVKDGMAALLTVQLKTKLLYNTNQILGFDLGKKRAHAATWMGLIITSSEGMASEWAFKLSIYS